MKTANLSDQIARLWNTLQQRENLYKQSMTLENLGTMRKFCSQGYMVSLLFKKEISWIYDEVKCTLSEGDITRGLINYNLPNLLVTADDQSHVSSMLLEQELQTINMYNTLIQHQDITYEAKMTMTDHIEKLYDLYNTLKKEVIKTVSPVQMIQQAVA